MRGEVKAVLTTVAAASMCLIASTSLTPSWQAYPTSVESVASSGRRQPNLPRRGVDTDWPVHPVRTISIPSHGDLQAALARAEPGDLIQLEEGATYEGPFRLPRKEGAGWVIVTSRSAAARLPSGRRVGPGNAAAMPRLVSAFGPVILTDRAAHNYRFIGLEISPTKGTFLRNLVQLGLDERALDDVPRDIIFERCYLHGDPQKGTRRGIAMNSRNTAVIDSYLSGFKDVGADSQAIAGWNGPGPFKIVNSFLEAAGENVMFGGADPTIPGLVPADILIRGNRLAKPLAWRAGDPGFEGTPWSVKNLFELKNARRVLVDSNIFDRNWPDAQNGFAILFTVRNQDGGAPWSVVEDVTFSNNVVRHVASGINVLGRDDIHTSQRTARIAIRNNLFVDIGDQWGGGRLFQVLDGTVDVSIDHNTGLQSGIILSGGDHAAHRGFVLQNNIVLHNQYGIIGSGTASGQATLDRYFPGATVRRNVIVGGQADRYPAENFFPSSIEEVGFISPQRGNYRLAASSPYIRAGSDGHPIGANLDALPGMSASETGTR